MAEQSIAKSFRGILRIANVKECTDKDDDVFFNPIYYGTPTKGTASESTGYDTAYNGLSGSLIRYSFPDDKYRHAMLPVTDSLGNYLNINLGPDGVTIGSDELNNGNNNNTVKFTQLLYNKENTQKLVFPVLRAKNLIVGLQERLLPESKSSVEGGSITIDESPYYTSVDAKLIINNKFDLTPSNRTDGVFNEIKDGKTYRTIFQDTNPQIMDYDVLMHYQDNIDENNLKNNNTIDSIVDVVNLKDYVKEKLNLYLSNNVVEVPTGFVIWQYINLKKWFCIDQSISGNSDNPFAGNNPPMGKDQDTDLFTPTLYQGVVRSGINRLVALSNEDSEEASNAYTQKQLKEMIPLYKRDYVLADGGVYTIYMLLPNMSNNYDYVSYDMFINLFFAIGYQYTDLNNIRQHYINTHSRTVDGEVVYGWAKNTRTVSTACTNKDVLFGVDLLSMLAIKEIYNELKYGTTNNGKSACIDANGNFSRQNTENWLKTHPLPKEFVFNSPIPSSNGGMIYKYTEGGAKNPKTYNIEIGLEVNSFGSDIWYYDHEKQVLVNDPNHGVTRKFGDYVKCKAWATAEVQSVLDLFVKVNIAREKELKNYFTFPFQVINAVQNVEDDYTTGTFFGFTPFIWADENQFDIQIQSVSSFSSSAHPHRHAIFMGPPEFLTTPEIQHHTGEVTSSSMARAMGMEWFYSGSWENGKPRQAYYENVNAYTLAEMGGLRYELTTVDGVPTYVIQWGDYTRLNHPDPRWRNAEPNRGVTGPPIDQGIIDEKYVSASANSITGEIKWFQPECVQMVPLIKL